jgi:streptogramin lyase
VVAALGVQIDQEGRVWGAANGPCRLIEADVATKKFIKTDIALPGCSSPWGVSIDNEGYVWVVDKANKAYKVDPDTYEIKLIVMGLVDPYTYSDMTGQGLQLVLPQ